jgi:hypothetical protein
VTDRSLAPFAHLLRRASARRTRLVVNVLFWLQLCILLFLALALANPVLFQRQAKTILVIMDTSASMAADWQGESVFERAKQRLLERLARKGRADHVLVMASTPVTALTAGPQRELTVIKPLVKELRVSHLAGHLATANQIGAALLGGQVDHTVVVTDEETPAGLAPDVEFLTVGKALPNQAIVGFDAHGELCRGNAAHLLVTVQNFSESPSGVRVVVEQQTPRQTLRSDSRLAEARASLEAGERTTLSIQLPQGSEGWMDIHLKADHDALRVDNHLQVLLRQAAALPVAVVSDRPAFRRLLGEWLDACEGLVWTEAPLTDTAGASWDAAVTELDNTRTWVVVTDGRVSTGTSVAGILQWLNMGPSSSAEGLNAPEVALAHWVVDSDHPVGSYLAPVERVMGSMPVGSSMGFSGEPIVWGLVSGAKVPLVLAGEQEGHRRVSVLVDPVISPDHSPLLMVFLNSLQWVMGQSAVVATGEPIWMASLERTPVSVERPDGAVEHFPHEGGVFHYDATTVAGRYRITQGATSTVWAANFLDPLESNLMRRQSTWRMIAGHPSATPGPPRTHRSLTNPLTWLIVILVLFEWWLYARTRG